MFRREFLVSILCVFFVGLQANWRCKNGQDFIAFSQRCDARIDCPDGSDETFAECHNASCAEHKCSYGACFKERQLCDGTPDCWDKTDEQPLLCNKEQMAEPEPMETVITSTCPDNHSRCECVRTCSDKSFHTDLSIRAVCSYKGKIKSCKSQDTKLFIGTEATVTCAPSYKPRNNAITSEIRSCQRNGQSEIPFWKKQMNKNHQLKCVPECGKILPTVKSDPWLVSIFKSDITLSNYTFQCFGTIISPWMVIVDKYWIDGEDVMHYAIAEGDQVTSFRKNEEHPYALHNLARISKSQIQTRLHLVNPFIFSASLRPICLPPLPNVPKKPHPNWIISITTADNQTIFYKSIAEEFLNQKKTRRNV